MCVGTCVGARGDGKSCVLLTLIVPSQRPSQRMEGVRWARDLSWYVLDGLCCPLPTVISVMFYGPLLIFSGRCGAFSSVPRLWNKKGPRVGEVRSLKGVELEMTSKDVFTTQQTGPPGFMCTAFVGPGLAHENAAEGSG